MFPTYERIEAVFLAIEPIVLMAAAGKRGLFNGRKRNAMLLGIYLGEAIQAKDQWQASGDYYHCKNAHEALQRGVRAAMKGSKLDFTPENESTALIVYSLLEACITRPAYSPIPDPFNIPGIAEAYLKKQAIAMKTQHGRDLF